MKRYILYPVLAALLFIQFCGSGRLTATTVGEIRTPAGYSRVFYNEKSYPSWLRGLSLKKVKTILRCDGRSVPDNYYNVFAVIDMPLLYSQDIEQCADWGMRFWSEYHRDMGMLHKLYLFDYSGNRKYFNASGRGFNGFLKYFMNYSNSHSIKSGCVEIIPGEVRGGDMIVQNRAGGIGHVSIVMDVCSNSRGGKLCLIGYSFMPAQQFHIERADDRYGKEGWFTLEGYEQYLRENLNYGDPVLRRFR